MYTCKEQTNKTCCCSNSKQCTGFTDSYLTELCWWLTLYLGLNECPCFLRVMSKNKSAYYLFILSGRSVIFWLIEELMEPFFKICLYINNLYLAYLILSREIFIGPTHPGQCYSLQVQSVILAVILVRFSISLYLNGRLVKWKEVRLFLIQWSHSDRELTFHCENSRPFNPDRSVMVNNEYQIKTK